MNNPEKLDTFGADLVSNCNDVVLLKNEKIRIQKEIDRVTGSLSICSFLCSFVESNIKDQQEIDALYNELESVRQEHIELNNVVLGKYEQQARLEKV